MASNLKSAVANFDAKASHGESSSTQIHLPSVDARVTSADPHEKVHPALGNSPLSPVESQPNLCAVVLAGGDGKRLQSFVRHVRDLDYQNNTSILLGSAPCWSIR